MMIDHLALPLDQMLISAAILTALWLVNLYIFVLERQTEWPRDG